MMGWLIAFLFAAICGLLAVFLFVQWDEKRQAVAKLQASAERLQFLEKQDIDLTALRAERDALARALLTLREAAGELEHVRQERARISAEAKAFVDKFNGQVSDARAKAEDRRKLLDAEANQLQAEIAGLREERDRLADEVNPSFRGWRSAVRRHNRVSGSPTTEQRPPVTIESLAGVPLTVLSIDIGHVHALPKVHVSLPKQAHDLLCTASLLH